MTATQPTLTIDGVTLGIRVTSENVKTFVEGLAE